MLRCAVPQPSEIRWASRWDTYLVMMDDQIHWFSIINSLMIVLFLSGARGGGLEEGRRGARNTAVSAARLHCQCCCSGWVKLCNPDGMRLHIRQGHTRQCSSP